MTVMSLNYQIFQKNFDVGARLVLKMEPKMMKTLTTALIPIHHLLE